ncbi:MAG: glutaredoxin family protein [Bacteroidota bacterium]
MILVELFSKEDCHLCQEALAVLNKVQREIHFSLVVRKIVPEDPRYEELKEKIPVVFINHEEAFHFHVDEPTLRRRLLTPTP